MSGLSALFLPSRAQRRRQRGSVLLVSLIVLIIMTLIVFSMLRSAVLELKIGGATQFADTLFNAAESAVLAFINQNDGRFADNCLSATQPVNSCFTDGAGNILPGVIDAAASRATTVPFPYQQGGKTLAEIALTARQIDCGDDSAVGSGNQVGTTSNPTLQAVYFDIEARSRGPFGENAAVSQGFKSPLPAGSCP